MSNSDPSKSSSSSKTRGKGAAFAIGIAAAVATGALGFQLAKSQDIAKESQTVLTLLPVKSQVAETDAVKLRLLHEKTRLQAEHIKELQLELNELNHSFHEYKLSLFSKSNPADLAQIEQLSEELDQKNALLKELTNRLDNASAPAIAGISEQEHNQVMLALSEEAVLSDDIQKIISERSLREAALLAKEQLANLQMQHAIAEINKQEHLDLSSDLAILFELEQTKSFLEKEKQWNALRKAAFAFSEKKKQYRSQIDELREQLEQRSEENKDLQLNLATYADLLTMTHQIHEEKNNNLKNLISTHRNKTLSKLQNLNNALQNRQTEINDLYSVIEAQQFLLDNAYANNEANGRLAAEAIANYENSLNASQKQEKDNLALAIVAATQEDILNYQHNVHSRLALKADQERYLNQLTSDHIGWLLQHNKELEGNLAQTQRQTSSALAMIKRLAGRVSASQEEVKEVKKNAAAATRDLEERTKALTIAALDQNHQMSLLNDEIAKLQGEKSNLASQIEYLTDQEQRAKAYSVSAVDHEHQLSLLNKEILALQEQKKLLIDQVSRSISALKKYKIENAALKEDLDNALTQLQQTDDLLVFHQELINRKEGELKNAQDSQQNIRSKLLEKLSSLQQDLDALTEKD